MKLSEIAQKGGFQTVFLPNPDAEATGAYTSDLLSDVMAHCQDGDVLVTVQNHKNSVAVCTLVGAPAVLIVHSRPIPDDMLAAARQENIAILSSSLDQFTVSCALGAMLGTKRPQA